MYKMFDFLLMGLDHENRIVARHEDDNLIVDTCAVNDSAQPFETGICHQDYNDGDWVIVQLYNTREEAESGHQKWVSVMTADELPNILHDVSSAGVADLLDAFQDDDHWRERKRIQL